MKITFPKKKTKNNPHSKLSEGHDCILKSQIIAKSLTWFLLVESSCWILVTVNNLNILRTEKRWDQTQNPVVSPSVVCNSLRPRGQAPLSMGVLQARKLEWVAMPASRGSSQPRNQTAVSHIADRFFTSWAAERPRRDYFPRNPSATALVHSQETNCIPGFSVVLLAHTVWLAAFDLYRLKSLYFTATPGHTAQYSRLSILGEQAIKLTPISETPLRCICKIHGFMFSLTPWLSAWGCLFRSCLELRSGKALDCFLSDVIIPAGPRRFSHPWVNIICHS